MYKNPYDPPKDTTEDQSRSALLGRNDCPFCATTQRRYDFISPWHKCRTCGSSLTLQSSPWVLNTIVLVGIALVAMFSFFLNKSLATWDARSLGIVVLVFFWVTKFAIGRPQVDSVKSQSGASGFLLFKMVASSVLCVIAIFVVILTGSVMPLMVACAICALILMASMILIGERGAQGHLVLPTPLRHIRGTLTWLLVAVALGAAIGTLL